MHNLQLDNLKIAIVYDKLISKYGGAEHVISTLLAGFPQAELYTAIYAKNVREWLGTRKIHSTFLQRWRVTPAFYKLLSPLVPLALETLNLDRFDIVISISSEHAKAVITKPKQLHLCYLLTPTRYLHSHSALYQKTEFLLKTPLIGYVAQQALKYLHRVDFITAQRPDYILPISKAVSIRTNTSYHRSTLPPLYPPAPIHTPSSLPQLLDLQYVFSASRLVPYKRTEHTIAAVLKLKKTLLIAGEGTQKHQLIAQAGNNCVTRKSSESLTVFLDRALGTQKKIWFLNQVTEAELASLFISAQVFVLPGVEDFGIAPLQAALYNTPSIIHRDSGVAELLPEPYSIHITEQTVAAVVAALQKLPQKKAPHHLLQARAKKYLPESFTTQFRKVVYDLFILKGIHVSS
jgi:glycosyltransferase involved in cell wall biosynthesis